MHDFAYTLTNDMNNFGYIAISALGLASLLCSAAWVGNQYRNSLKFYALALLVISLTLAYIKYLFPTLLSLPRPSIAIAATIAISMVLCAVVYELSQRHNIKETDDGRIQ